MMKTRKKYIAAFVLIIFSLLPCGSCTHREATPTDKEIEEILSVVDASPAEKPRVREECVKYEKEKEKLAAGGSSFLHKAAMDNDFRIIRCLLQDEDVDVNVKDNFGRTPLHILAADWGAFYPDEDDATFILQYGVDINARDNYGMTPLHHAVIAWNFDAMWTLAEHKAEIDAPGKDDATPLAYALLYRYYDIAEELIAHGAQKLIPKEKFMPYKLHWAAFTGNIELVKKLVKEGADVNAEFSIDRDKLNCDIEICFDKIEKGFLCEYDKGLTPLGDAVRFRRHEVAKFLIDNNADLNVPHGSHYLLYLAAQANDIEMVKLLLENGVDVNPPTGDAAGDGVSRHNAFLAAIHEIIVGCDVSYDLLELLLKNGADPNAEYKDGKSWLQQPSPWFWPQNRLKNLLIEYGAIDKPSS